MIYLRYYSVFCVFLLTVTGVWCAPAISPSPVQVWLYYEIVPDTDYEITPDTVINKMMLFNTGSDTVRIKTDCYLHEDKAELEPVVDTLTGLTNIPPRGSYTDVHVPCNELDTNTVWMILPHDALTIIRPLTNTFYMDLSVNGEKLGTLVSYDYKRDRVLAGVRQFCAEYTSSAFATLEDWNNEVADDCAWLQRSLTVRSNENFTAQLLVFATRKVLPDTLEKIISASSVQQSRDELLLNGVSSSILKINRNGSEYTASLPWKKFKREMEVYPVDFQLQAPAVTTPSLRQFHVMVRLGERMRELRLRVLVLPE